MKNRMVIGILCVVLSACGSAQLAFPRGVAEGKLYDISRAGATAPVAIVPGVSAGPITFSMTKDEMVRVLGKPDTISYGDTRFLLRDSPTAAYYVFGKAGLSVFMELGKIRSISVLSELYEYPGGIRVGMSISRAEAILGKMLATGSVTEADGRIVEVYQVFFSGKVAYRLAYYEKGTLALKINEDSGLVTEIRLAPSATMLPRQPVPDQEGPVVENDIQVRRAIHERVLRDTTIPLGRYALTPVRSGLKAVDKTVPFWEETSTECWYVLKSAAEYEEGARAADRFISALDTMGAIGPSVFAIVKTYGIPTAFRIEQGGDGDAIWEFCYGSLRLYMDRHGRTLWSARFSRSSPGYKYRGRIGVDSTQEEVYAELGKPLRTAPGGLAGTPQDRTLFVWKIAGKEFSSILYEEKGLEFRFADGKVWTVTRTWHQ